jgi:hypothetical protein
LHSNVYDWYYAVDLETNWQHKNTGKIRQDVNRICKWCRSENKNWESTDKQRWGNSSNLWTHLGEAHRYYRPSKGPRLPSVAVGQQRISGYIGMDHSLPIREVTLEQAIIEFVVDMQSPLDIVENKKF